MSNYKWIFCALAVLIVSHGAEGTWSMFISPFQWIRDVFSSQSSAEFSRRIGELEEYNVTFLNDSRQDRQLWPNLTVAVQAQKNETTVANRSMSSPNFQNNTSGPFDDILSNRSGVVGFEQNSTEAIVEDRWMDYFEQLLSHDTAFCFSLLVCEISAQPDNFLEYGRRVARFFETYQPSASNSAGWWYVNAAELGRTKRSLAECRANYPFCFVDTKQLVALLEVPPTTR